MLARVNTFSIDGLDTSRVTVEVDIRQGLPAFAVVGLGDAAIREARERVKAAVLNSGFSFPDRKIVANLAPAALRKGGSGFDLPIAVGILAASGQVPTVWWQDPNQGDEQWALPEQPFEQRWHFDVWVPHDEGERRLQAVLNAGGRLISDRAAPAYWVVEDAAGNRACICTPAGR